MCRVVADAPATRLPATPDAAHLHDHAVTTIDHRRRRFVVASGAAGMALAAGLVRAEGTLTVPAIPALETLLDHRPVRDGRVHIDIPKLADNGNSVPLVVNVDSPMTDTDRVVALHVYSERNPRPRIASIELGPDVGRAELQTRIRLAGTQSIVAVAQMSDGSLWGATAEVIVTQSACTDDPP
jgi:sulfur-oxidizing protein SoxY